MDKKGIAFLMLALVTASLAAAGVYLYLKGMPVAEAQAPETVPVVVANGDLTFGTTLKEEHLRVVEFPKSSIPSGTFSSVDSVTLPPSSKMISWLRGTPASRASRVRWIPSRSRSLRIFSFSMGS